MISIDELSRLIDLIQKEVNFYEKYGLSELELKLVEDYNSLKDLSDEIKNEKAIVKEEYDPSKIEYKKIAVQNHN